MTEANVIFNGTSVSDPESGGTPSPVAHALFRLSKMELPAKERFESYLRYKARSNHKQKTIEYGWQNKRVPNPPVKSVPPWE